MRLIRKIDILIFFFFYSVIRISSEKCFGCKLSYNRWRKTRTRKKTTCSK